MFCYKMLYTFIVSERRQQKVNYILKVTTQPKWVKPSKKKKKIHIG